MATLTSSSKMDTKDTKNQTKVAVKFSELPDKPLLTSINTTLSAREIVNAIVTEYKEQAGLSITWDKPEDYDLCLTSQSNGQDQNTLNERNRNTIGEGTIMHLVRSPSYYVRTTLESLSKEKETVLWNSVLKDLHKRFLLWPEFVQVFVSKQGHIQLLDLLKSGQCSASIPTICYQAGLHFNLLMSIRLLFLKYGLVDSRGCHETQNRLVSWQLMDDDVLVMLISGMRRGDVTPQTLECSYELLDNCIQMLPDKASMIISEITSDKLYYHLKNDQFFKSDTDSTKSMQSCLVNFLNTIFLQAKKEGKRNEMVNSLLGTEGRDVLRKCIKALRDESAEVKGPFLSSLITLQQHLLCSDAIRATTGLDPTNESILTFLECILYPPQTALQSRASIIVELPSEQAMSSLNLMRSFVQKGELSNRMSNWRFGPAEAAQFKALGFQNDMQPHLDFDAANCGMLAFDCIMYFAQHCPKETEEMVGGKSYQEGEKLPFIHACTVVTRILVTRLRILDGGARSNHGADATNFFPLLFCEDKPFEKVFCKCLSAFARTWRDMRATSSDMDIVHKVFLDQLNYTFNDRSCRQRLSLMVEGLMKNSYSEVVRRQKLREEEQKKSNSLVLEIRHGLKPRLDQLIVDNRLRHMERGDNFQLAESNFFGVRSKEAKYILLRLSPNHKELYYEITCNESAAWKHSDELDDKLKISIASIQNIVYGTNCSHASSKKIGSGLPSQCITLAVSMPTESGTVKPMDINLCARSKNVFDIWMDGMNYLKRSDARSSRHERDFETLFDLEVKVRCLHLPAGLDVTQPIIPPRPPDVMPAEMYPPTLLPLPRDMIPSSGRPSP